MNGSCTHSNNSLSVAAKANALCERAFIYRKFLFHIAHHRQCRSSEIKGLMYYSKTCHSRQLKITFQIGHIASGCPKERSLKRNVGDTIKLTLKTGR